MNTGPDPAPRVFISYSHDSQDFRTNIEDFAQSLRSSGVDARIDLFLRSLLSWFGTSKTLLVVSSY